VGKSNLFDAIRFLTLTASTKLDDAARSIRSEGNRNADVRSSRTPRFEVVQALRCLASDGIAGRSGWIKTIPPEARGDL
jgi:hypothetical protein